MISQWWVIRLCYTCICLWLWYVCVCLGSALYPSTRSRASPSWLEYGSLGDSDGLLLNDRIYKAFLSDSTHWEARPKYTWQLTIWLHMVAWAVLFFVWLVYSIFVLWKLCSSFYQFWIVLSDIFCPPRTAWYWNPFCLCLILILIVCVGLLCVLATFPLGSEEESWGLGVATLILALLSIRCCIAGLVRFSMQDTVFFLNTFFPKWTWLRLNLEASQSM